MALRKDAVYNPQKRAKIVRKACKALLGFTTESDTEVTTTNQEELAEALLQRAPQSLSDPAKLSKDPVVGNLGVNIASWPTLFSVFRFAIDNNIRMRKSGIGFLHLCVIVNANRRKREWDRPGNEASLNMLAYFFCQLAILSLAQGSVP